VPTYLWGVGPPDGDGPTHELGRARTRKYDLRLEQSATASFSIDGADEAAAEVLTLGSDVWVRRDGLLVYRGRVTADPDTISPDVHTVSVTTTGYRGMLRHRNIMAGATTEFRQTPQSAIAWTLIADSQAQVGGDWGIVRGLHQGDGHRDRTYQYGENLLTLIDNLGKVENGFDWDIDPNLAFNTWAPLRGSHTGAVLDLGGSVVQMVRTPAVDRFASAVGVKGDEGTVPAEAFTAALLAGSEPRGRIERIFNEGTVLLQDTLTAKANFYAARMGTVPAAYNVLLRPGWWRGPNHVGPGDWVRLLARTGRLAVDDELRVYQVGVAIDDSGTERVSLALQPEGVA
jgi:hypothetical protein